MNWIRDWSMIEDDKQYIVCAIGQKWKSPDYYVYQPHIQLGWQVKRLWPGCYVATLFIPPTQEELTARVQNGRVDQGS